jgi:hypothetical protein
MDPYLNRNPSTKYEKFHSSSGMKRFSEYPRGAEYVNDIRERVKMIPIAQLSGSSSSIWNTIFWYELT